MFAHEKTTKRAMSDVWTRRKRGGGVALTAVFAVLGAMLVAGPAQGAGPVLEAGTVTTAPGVWRGGDMGDTVTLSLRNAGDTAISPGDPISVVVTPPAGLTLRDFVPALGWTCTLATKTCVYARNVNAGGPTNNVGFRFAVDKSVTGDLTASFAVSGGGSPSFAFEKTVTVEPFRPFGVHDFVAGAYDVDGDALAQAGAHPDTAKASFEFNANTDIGGSSMPVEDVRQLITDLPAGFIGNPQVVTECPESVMVLEQCPPEAFVGRAIVRIGGQAVGAPTGIYNIKPGPGHAAEFGFAIVGIGVTFMYADVRTDGDYGVTITVPTTPAGPKIDAVSVELFGNPADPKYDPVRCARMEYCFGDRPSSNPPKPFLTMQAAECTPVEPITRLSIDSWEHKGTFFSFDAASPAVTGCEKLTFEPAVDIAPTTNLPDTPSGLKVDMIFPQEDNAEGLAPPALKKAVVTLPEGMTINPAGAGGLEACADGELLLKSKDPMTCPEASKVGTVTAKSPLLKETLTGGVYIRSQNSSNPESGEMFRLALVLENKERGLSVRLPGQIRVNKQTGRIETTFDNNPELPVESLKLRFKDGPRAPLATPATCGPKTIDTVLTSWGKQTKTLQSTFNVACLPGLGSFGPGFRAGSADPTAAGSSPFNLLLTRADGHDVLDGLKLVLPEGLLANLKGNVGTQVGTVLVDAGPGSQPFRFPGKVYLEGPYADAPFSLKVVVPAKAGPFDLGEVVVRQKIYVDPTDAHVTVVSDPIPTIVEGVPVRLRSMNVSVNKPGFMINPTSCAEKRIDATVHSLTGKSANVASRFQVGGCAALPLQPKMRLSLTGKAETGYHKHPGLSAEVTQVPGESGLKKVTVSLPLSLALDPDNARALCKPEQAVAKACPEGSIIGDATAVSPVLNRPLTGHVYFVEGLRTSKTGRVIKTLPKLWVALRGEVSLDVWADSAVKNRRLVNTFGTVPDAPISSFKLNVKGGANGILKVTGEQGNTLCKGNQVADARFDGQNGRRLVSKTRMSTPCGFKAVSSSLGASRARVVVGGLGKGRLTLSGSGVRKTSRSVSSDVVTVNASLTTAGRRAYRSGKSVRVKVAFTPEDGKAKTVSVSVKRPTAKGAARR